MYVILHYRHIYMPFYLKLLSFLLWSWGLYLLWKSVQVEAIICEFPFRMKAVLLRMYQNKVMQYQTLLRTEQGCVGS